MSLLTSTNTPNTGGEYYIPITGAVNPFPIPGPAGPQGAVGPQGAQGLQGVNAYGSWYYSIGLLPPAPQTMSWTGTDIYFSLVSIPPGTDTYLRALQTQFLSTGAMTLYISTVNGGGAAVGFTAAVTAINFFDGLGYAQFTYTLVGPIPVGILPGAVVNVFDGGGTVGPAGPPGPAGAAGAAATIAVGATNTLPPGSLATVVNSGTPNAAILDFGIPEGAQGPPGPAGPPDWSNYPAVSNVDTGGFNITNVNTVNAGTLGSTNIDCYQSTVTGFGTLQVGSPVLLAPNPGTLNVNGTATIQRGTSNTYINAGGIVYQGDSVIPGANGVRFGTIPVSGVNTCRMELNTVTAPAAIQLVAPSFVTIDTAGAANITAAGAALVQAGNTVTIESAAKDIRLQGTAGTYSDVHMYGGTLDGMGNITGQAGTGVALGNVGSVTGVGSTISVATTLNGGAGVSYNTQGDVVSNSAGSTPNSLNTLGTRVRFRDTTEFFVSNNGNDITGDGSVLNPYATIQKAITQAELISSAANICVINVASGNYVGDLTFAKGYVMLCGALSTQTANEITEITGGITITCAGAADLFNRQVIFQGFNITCGAGKLCTDNSTTSHTVAFQDCKIFSVGRFFNGISTGADARTYFTNCEISQTNVATTDSTVRVNLGAVELERVDITTDGAANCLEISGTASLTRCGLCTFENTNATGAAVVQISTTSLAIMSIGNTSLTYTNAAAKAPGAAIAGIYINSGVNTTLILIGNVFNLAGTSSSTNFVVSYNGVGSPTVLTYGNMAAYLPPTINYANTIQTGITKTRYWDPNPMNSGAWSSTANQANTTPGAQILCTVNTTESPAGQGGITLVANTFYPNNYGTYEITYTATFTNTGADADVYLWAALSGTRIGRSASRDTIPNNHQKTVTKTITFNCTPGQFFSFYWLCSSANVSLATTAAGGAGLQPAVPSFYASIVQVA